MITIDVKKIVKNIVNVFTYILLAILILIIYGKAVMTFTNNMYPNFFGYTVLQVESGSMEPTISTSDIILVKLDNNNVQKDDIISYISEGSIITHRVMFIDGDKYTCKGDANNTIDTTITKSMIIGEVVKIYPKLGIWKKVFSEPQIILVLFITLVLFDIALSRKKPEEKKKEEKKEEEEEITITKVELPDETPQINKEELLEFTKTIDLTEINKMLAKNDEYKMTTKEVNELKKDIKEIDEEKKTVDDLEDKQKEFINYTMRLDLSEIQKRIKDRVK